MDGLCPERFQSKGCKYITYSAGVQCVLQKAPRGRAGQVDGRSSCCTSAMHRSPICLQEPRQAHKQLQAGTKAAIPALPLSSFRGSSPTGTSDLTQLLCSRSAAPLERRFCNERRTMGFDVLNQRIAEKDKIIPVSSKSVPKEQLQLQVHRSLAASQPL